MKKLTEGLMVHMGALEAETKVVAKHLLTKKSFMVIHLADYLTKLGRRSGMQRLTSSPSPCFQSTTVVGLAATILMYIRGY